MLYERLIEKLKDHQKELEDYLLDNNINNFENYRYQTGRIRGIKNALEIVRATFKGDNNE